MATDSNAQQCYYETLGLQRACTQDEITTAYKRIARAHHPDRTLNKTEEQRAASAEVFKAASAAHEVLSDPSKRRQYDMFGHAGVGSGASDDSAEMFEAMFGASHKAKRPRGFVGGAMFVDAERGQFFQRKFTDVDAMRAEMTDGLPDATPKDEGDSWAASTSVPAGPWEVRLVETDEAAAALVVTLCAGDKPDAEAETDPEWQAIKSTLRLSRTFALPAECDLDAAEVTLDAQAGTLSVSAPKKGVASPCLASPNSVASPRLASPSGVDELPTMAEAAAEAAAEALEAEALAAEATAEATAEAAAEAAEAAHARVKAMRARRRKKASSLRAGFLNDKPRKKTASTNSPARSPTQSCADGKADGPRPMEVEMEGGKENADAAMNALDAAMRAQLDALTAR